MERENSNPLSLFTVFHLNLAYSSIEVEQRPEVIRRCYWPLLRLAREFDLPLGIEASGYTLDTIAALDPEWLEELRSLITQGPCEFIGSGYAQLIGPLVPARLNTANLRLGQEVYQDLLGFRPRIALVNEQAYSAGLVPLYLEAGYQAIVMEWNNAARYHPQWPRAWRYFPQRACGPGGESIPVIWNDAISFQKFQRYGHGELELEEYLAYLKGHFQVASIGLADGGRVFPLYGNDVEIFDFRPGRYATEGEVHPQGEWERLRSLMGALHHHPHLDLISPRQVLSLLDRQEANNLLHLESPEQPIPVKKQGKYNVTRWAITGRDDLGINSACWRLYQALEANPETDPAAWKKLCYLWSSDFRTHITWARWQEYRQQLAEAEAQWCGPGMLGKPGKAGPPPWAFQGSGPPASVTHSAPGNTGLAAPPWQVDRQGRFLQVMTPKVKATLNCRRGLAIEALQFPEIAAQPLIGTLPHGYYEDISLGADFYSGNTIIEIPGRRRISDLNQVEPQWLEVDNAAGTAVRVRASVALELGVVTKNLDIYLDQSRVDLSYSFKLADPLEGSCRTGILTLIPTAFLREQLFYRTMNGGYQPETFYLAGRTVDHSEPASVLVSARHGLGATGGWIDIGDHRHHLKITFDPGLAAMLPLVFYKEGNGHYFLRVYFSLRELDETRRLDDPRWLISPTAITGNLRGQMSRGPSLVAMDLADCKNRGHACGLTISGVKTAADTQGPTNQGQRG